MRQNYSSGTQWENEVGYSRAVKVGNSIEVAGTTAFDGEKIVGIGDPYEQSVFIFNKIKEGIEALGGSLKDVVRTRMYVTNIEEWQEVTKAHSQFFRDIKPVATMVEVSRLVHPDLLVEIEATAVLEG